MDRKLSIENVLNIGTDACFVAMDFSSKYRHIFDEMIGPVIEDVGLIAVRSDRIVSAASNVVDEIISVIQASRAVVVDITGLNPNVLLELGISHALRRPIVLITQDEQVPFDIQPRRVIKYDQSNAGRLRFQEDLAAAIRSCIYPKETRLGDMLRPSPTGLTFVIHGGLPEEHLTTVYPPIDSNYSARLSNVSIQTTAIWDIGLALQKLAWGQGAIGDKVVAAEGVRASADVLKRGNAFIIGGPGVNPFWVTVSKELANRYSGVPQMTAFAHASGKKRFSVTRNGEQIPMDQDALLSANVDIGVVLRCPNPYLTSGTVWLAAGLRSYGTEAAVQMLVTPSLIAQLENKLVLHKGPQAIWAVLAAKFDPVEGRVLDVSVYAAGELDLK